MYTSLERLKCDYKNLCGKFRLHQKKLYMQYNQYYLQRLRITEPLILKSIKNIWGSETQIVNISDISEQDRKVVVGIIFKKMKLQANLLKEIYLNLEPHSIMDKYISDEDYLLLQDNKQITRIEGNIDVHSHVTGIVTALFGSMNISEGIFFVENFCYPLPDVIDRPFLLDDKFILIICGLGFTQEMTHKLAFSQTLFKEFIKGTFSIKDAEKSSKIVKIIIAGNCIEKSANNFRSRFNINNEAMKMFDDFISDVGCSVDIDIMPGPNDPSHLLLPQQPFPPCILPKSSILSSIRCVTNPYMASFDNVVLLGTSGQNIKSIYEYSQLNDSLEILEKTLDWAHMAPNAPDSLHSYPFEDTDPFIINSVPDIYFASNQKQYKTKIKRIHKKEIRLICLPDFQTSLSCVLINLKNLNCELLSFG